MKAYKTITIVTIILLVAILSVISFGGLYVLKDFKARDVLKKYQFGKEYSKSRAVELTVDSGEEEKIYDKDGNEVTEKEEGVEYTEENGYTIVEASSPNASDSLTKENYKKAKNIIAKRLKALKVEEYNIKLNETDGTINIDMTENDKTDDIISLLIADGTFELQDSETNEVLLNNSHIKTVKTATSQADETTIVVYLQIAFNKEGAKKLEEISKTYIETKPASTNEDGEEVPAESKDVTLYINGEEIRTTHFGDTLTNGILNIPTGTGTSSDSIKQTAELTNDYAITLNTGLMPIKYEQTNTVKEKTMDLFNNKIVLYSTLAIAVIAFLFLIIKLRLKGLLATVLEVGYIALLLLAIRYTNVKITLLSIIGIAVGAIFNYYYLYRAFKNIDLDFIKDTTKKIAFVLIPAYILAIVFTFSSVGRIASLGMALVWGIIIMYLYNLSLTQIALKTLKDK